MAKEYLDKAGLTYLWSKLKDYFQVKLVSGTNIKTINNNSLLGSGNITISGGGGLELGSFVVEEYTHAYSTVSSGNNMSWSETVTKSGYCPIGVVGFRTARAALLVNSCYISNEASGSCTINMNARAVASASATTASMWVLWIKIS